MLIVPGIYLAVKYQFVPYLIVDKGMDPIEAFKESGKMTDGSKWDLLLLLIVLGMIVIIGFLAFIVGSFVAIPVVMVAEAYVYKKLSSDTLDTGAIGTITQSDMPTSDNPFQAPAP